MINCCVIGNPSKWADQCFPSLSQDVDHLRPAILRALANAELYCMALSHLYQDPNYHNLNHWGIVQALARKGIAVQEPVDCALTETMLIQTNPIKMVRLFFSISVVRATLINLLLHFRVLTWLWSKQWCNSLPKRRWTGNESYRLCRGSVSWRQMSPLRRLRKRHCFCGLTRLLSF